MDTTSIVNAMSSLVSWAFANWTPLLLTVEIIGAVVAIKLGRYRKGVFWLVAALVTIWVGWL